MIFVAQVRLGVLCCFETGYRASLTKVSFGRMPAKLRCWLSFMLDVAITLQVTHVRLKRVTVKQTVDVVLMLTLIKWKYLIQTRIIKIWTEMDDLLSSETIVRTEE